MLTTDAFYHSNGRIPPEIPDQPIDPNDSTDAAYSIAGNWPEVGFIVENPKQPRTPGSFTITVKSPTKTRIKNHIQ